MKTSFKTLTLISFMVLSTSAWADKHAERSAPSPLQFQQHKNKIITNIQKHQQKMTQMYQKRLNIFSEQIGCVSGAQTRLELKTCQKKTKEAMNAFRTEAKKHREEMKAQRMAKKQAQTQQ